MAPSYSLLVGETELSRRYVDLVTRDYSKWLTADDVVKNVKKYSRNGSIITFHDSLKSIDKLRTALPESLQWLKEQGYAFKVFPDDPAETF